MLFTESVQSSWSNSSIVVAAGSLSMLDRAVTTISSASSVVVGSLLTLGDSAQLNVNGATSALRVTAGTMLVQQQAQLVVSDEATSVVQSSLVASGNSLVALSLLSSLTVNGDVSVSESANLEVTGASSLHVIGGSVSLAGSASVVVDQASSVTVGSVQQRRKRNTLAEALAAGSLQVSEQAVLTVSGGSSVTLAGVMQMQGASAGTVSGVSQIEVLGGDLSLSDTASLVVTELSSVVVTSGTANVGPSSRLEVQPGSQVLTRDQLSCAGEIASHTGSTVQVDPSGRLTFVDMVAVYHVVTDGSDSSDLPMLLNHGVVDMCQATQGGVVQSAFHNNGSFSACRGAFAFAWVNNMGNATFNSTFVSLNGSAIVNATRTPLMNGLSGTMSGTVNITGNVQNDGTIAHHPELGTHLRLRGSYTHGPNATLDVLILDPTAPGSGFTRIDIGGNATFNNGTIRICLGSFDRTAHHTIELIRFGGRTGNFANIVFECSEQNNATLAAHNRRRAVTYNGDYKDQCASTRMSGTNFAVLFNGCNANFPSVTFWISLSFFCFVILVAIIVMIMYVFVPPFARLVRGRDGVRRSMLRVAAKQASRQSSTASTGLGSFASLQSEQDDLESAAPAL